MKNLTMFVIVLGIAISIVTIKEGKKLGKTITEEIEKRNAAIDRKLKREKREKRRGGK